MLAAKHESGYRQRENARRRERRATDPGYRECLNIRDQEYRAAHPAYRERMKERARAWNAANPGRSTIRRLADHGFTADDYDAILAEQGGGCGICGTTDPGRAGARRLSVDHDHSHHPGRYGCPVCFRGALCSPCNVRLGHAEKRHNTEYLNSPPVAAYLNAYAARRQMAA